MRYCYRKMAYFAVPRYVEILSGLPRNATSRVMKTALREVGITDATWDFVALGLRIDRESRR